MLFLQFVNCNIRVTPFMYNFIINSSIKIYLINFPLLRNTEQIEWNGFHCIYCVMKYVNPS